ncbi:hypothetical protein F7725_024541 [Dissostichus mawsoni]|uniref:Uncharacterized protein n=1 Tax=Dissostichus mawsoni TaxID=36200 RepID=A0A7J5XZT1_DISMA|nr:hypothetical protein F7725_024541 [Dissostichus mawsoni]
MQIRPKALNLTSIAPTGSSNISFSMGSTEQFTNTDQVESGGADVSKCFTNVNGRCYCQGYQGLVLHDDMFTCCHRDKVPNPICFGYSMDHFLSDRGHVQCCTVMTLTNRNDEPAERGLTALRLCLMRAARRRLDSPRTPAWSLASHHSMTRASSTAVPSSLNCTGGMSERSRLFILSVTPSSSIRTFTRNGQVSERAQSGVLNRHISFVHMLLQQGQDVRNHPKVQHLHTGSGQLQLCVGALQPGQNILIHHTRALPKTLLHGLI